MPVQEDWGETQRAFPEWLFDLFVWPSCFYIYPMLACIWKQTEIILHAMNCKNGTMYSFFTILSSWLSSFHLPSLTGCSRIDQCLQYLPILSTVRIYFQETVKLLQAQRFQLFYYFTMIPSEKCSLPWENIFLVFGNSSFRIKES